MLVGWLWLGCGLLAGLACVVPPDQGSAVGRVSLLVRRLGAGMRRIITHRVLGPRAGRWFEELLDWLWNKPNPVGPGIYLVLVHGGYLSWRWTGLTYIPEDSWHRPVTAASMVFCLGTFLLACFSDPGRITPANLERHLRTYPYDGLLFAPDTACDTCGLAARPARSKHCRVCNRCVPKFDHHCLFLNNDVSGRNHRYFLLFLWAHVYFCAYASWMLGWNLRVIARREQLWEAQYLDHATGQVVPASMWMVSRWLGSHHTLLWMEFVLASAMVPILAGFAGYHLMLACRNQTTNERHKRGILRKAVRGFLASPESAHDTTNETLGPCDDSAPAVGCVPLAAIPDPVAAAAAAAVVVRRPKQRATASGSRRPIRGQAVATQEAKKPVVTRNLTLRDLAGDPHLLDNIYDRGIFWNLVEALLQPNE